MANNLANAHALAERGFQVFPVKSGAKFPPLVQDWPNRATANSAEVSSLFAQAPDANIAIHTRGLVVLDVDVRSDGDVTLAKLAAEHELPATLTTRTPTGGRHLFYRLPKDHPGVPNGANKLGPGIDIKSTNGYVLAPGSEVEAGRYIFESDVPIAEAPGWLVDILGEYRKREERDWISTIVNDADDETVSRAREWLSQRPVGAGHSYSNACMLRDFGLSLDQALEIFGERDSRDDALAQVRHAYRYAQNEPGAKVAKAEDRSRASACCASTNWPSSLPAPIS